MQAKLLSPSFRAALRSAALIGALSITALPAAAHDFVAGDLEIQHPVAPPTPPGVSSAAGYLIIVNSGSADDRLLGGSTPVASDLEIHQTLIEDDVARMRQLDDGLLIPAGGTVRLTPGGTHLMFIGLTEALPDGERRDATLVFERAGSVDVSFAIEVPEYGAETMPQMDHSTMGHDGGAEAEHSSKHGKDEDEPESVLDVK